MNPRLALRDSVTRAAFYVQPLSPVGMQVPTGVYQPLIERLAAMRRNLGTGVVAAFSAVSRGEGVTYVVESLAWELATQTGAQTLLTTPDGLRSAASARFGDGAVRSLLLHPVRRLRSAEAAGRRWDDLAQQDFEGLRRRFGFVLVDCPVIRASRAAPLAPRRQSAMGRFHTDVLAGPSEDSAVLSVCRWCDGVVLVVSAGETQRKDILYAQSAIQVASANLLGFVLNKGVEPVPGFISRLLG